MSENSLPQRQSFRLKGYDYKSGGAYFVTVCTDLRQCFLSEISGGKLILNDLGSMVEQTLRNLPGYYEGVSVIEQVIMPNHIHVVFFLEGDQSLSLTELIQRFKSFTTKSYQKGLEDKKWAGISKYLWQRNYYENIIRSEEELERVCEYIANNPIQWNLDEENPLRRTATND